MTTKSGSVIVRREVSDFGLGCRASRPLTVPAGVVSSTRITARPATRDEAEALDLPPGVPMIDLWHTGMTADKQPFEVTNFCMRADYSALDYDMPVDY